MIHQQIVPATDTQHIPLIDRQTVPVEGCRCRTAGVVGELSGAVIIPVGDIDAVIPETRAVSHSVELIVVVCLSGKPA